MQRIEILNQLASGISYSFLTIDILASYDLARWLFQKFENRLIYS